MRGSDWQGECGVEMGVQDSEIGGEGGDQHVCVEWLP